MSNMLKHMRTTFIIDDDLMRRVKEKAARSGKTITAIVEEALTKDIAGDSIERKNFTLHWNPVDGPPLPGIDLSDRDALYEMMEKGD